MASCAASATCSTRAPIRVPAIDAHGTTLNGQAFAGDFLGPVTTSAFQLMGPNTIRF
jgi:hypothetical protein